VSIASSDDATFTARQVPTLAFFSGFHRDYHRPSDDWDRIDAQGAIEVARIALALTERLARRPDRPAFVAPPAPAAPTAVTEAGYGPYFGSVPDFVDSVPGVRFADIRSGSPADQAGIRRGDVLVQFDGRPVTTIHDFTQALREKRAGDIVRVVVLRQGREVAAEVTLGVRP
jgi:S1-C subfamily serine protease